MKNQSYPIIPVVLTALLVVALPRSGWAQYNFITNADDTITITGYTGSGGNVVITNMINGYKVTAIGDFAFYQGGLTGVTIPDSVTSIGFDAFAYCSGLTNVTIGNGVTTIGNAAFEWCSRLTSVTIPNSVTNIGDRAFEGWGLTSVAIPDGVSSIGTFAFASCSALTSIDVDATNSSYASAGGVLFNKDLTTLVEYPGGLAGSYAIPESVTTIGDGAFYYCSGLTNVTIGKSVINIGYYAFGDCSGLMSVTIPDSVTSIGGGAFGNCSGLTNIDVAATNPNYASSGGVLFNITLTTLIQYPGRLTGSYAIPDSVTSIGDYVFWGCSGLTNVTIPNSVTSIGNGAFVECGLWSVTIPDSVTSIGISAFAYCSGLTNVTIGNSVASIGDYAFYDCSHLHQAYFQGNAPSVNGGPGSADTTVFAGEGGTVYYMPGTTGWTDQFGGWPTAVWSSPATDFTYITNNDAITITGYIGSGGRVIIPGTINTYSVTAIGDSAFYNQTNLTSVMIPDSITSIGDYAFEYCSSLTSVTIPDSVTSIGDSAFGGCRGLTNVAIPDSVTSIGTFAFSGCSGLTSVVIPGSVTNISGGAFAGCFGLTNIDVDATNSSYASEGGVLFNKTMTTLIQYPTGLAGSYAIPDSVTSIGDYAFLSCGLTSVAIPDSVGSIGYFAFAECSGLTNVTIPDSVTIIGAFAFSCPNLHQAYFRGNAPSVLGWPLFARGSVFGGSGWVYYVPGTTGWGYYFGGYQYPADGWPTAPWYQPRPQILGSGYALGVGSNGFQFTISWATNTAVVVEASTNLQDWTPVSTNTLVSGTNLFWDSDWTHHPQRFYRVGVEQ